jgi:hypothetical protein
MQPHLQRVERRLAIDSDDQLAIDHEGFWSQRA